MDMNQLVKVLENEPLIEYHPSLQRMADTILNNNGGALFYGTGLCNIHKLTIAMPFDVLGMVLVAEKLRRVLGLSRVFHHIADTHALCNFPNDGKGVFNKAMEIEAVMRKVTIRLGLHHFTILRSSSFDASPRYVNFMRQVGGPKDEEYIQRELADMLWYQNNYGVVLKLGWAAKDFNHDERIYDDEFIRLFGKTLSFIYTESGRTFTKKVAPYIATSEEDRIFLRAGEQVQAKFDKAASQTRKDVIAGTTKYFAAICRLYDRLVCKLDKGSVSQKIQQIIDHIFE